MVGILPIDDEIGARARTLLRRARAQDCGLGGTDGHHGSYDSHLALARRVVGQAGVRAVGGEPKPSSDRTPRTSQQHARVRRESLLAGSLPPPDLRVTH
jgi:hypothetical protein